MQLLGHQLHRPLDAVLGVELFLIPPQTKSSLNASGDK
jgi:hypothetical protein